MIPPPLAPAAVVGRTHAARKWPFGFGRRFFVLLAAGAVLAIPAWIDRRAIVAMLAWDVLLLLVWCVDLRRIGPAALEVRRSWQGPLALGVATEVTIGVVNDGSVGLHV